MHDHFFLFLLIFEPVRMLQMLFGIRFAESSVPRIQLSALSFVLRQRTEILVVAAKNDCCLSRFFFSILKEGSLRLSIHFNVKALNECTGCVQLELPPSQRQFQALN